ncbi:MAG: helix-turn-helix domain-containing protein [Candidatus Atribacteria bacterium]|nr:helix-turn-helix domain-containing protein [Candidatus Atribacteria bacterium]
MIDLIKKLEIYRLENRITQKQITNKLNVAFSTVNRWFNDKTTPSKIQQYHINKLLKEHNLKDKHFEIT